MTVRRPKTEPSYFTQLHRQWIGHSGRVHAIVPSKTREDPLIKVGFGDPKQIVFFRLADLDVDEDEPPRNPPRHGERGSHLPKK